MFTATKGGADLLGDLTDFVRAGDPEFVQSIMTDTTWMMDR